MGNFKDYIAYFSPAELEEFKKAMNSEGNRTGNTFDSMLENSRRFDSFADFIDGTLRWAETPQGQDFWSSFPNKHYRILPYNFSMYARTSAGEYVKIGGLSEIAGLLPEEYVCDAPDSYGRVFVMRGDTDGFKRISREWFRTDYQWIYVPMEDYVRTVKRTGYNSHASSSTMARKHLLEVNPSLVNKMIPIPLGADEYDDNSFWVDELSMNLSGYYFEGGEAKRIASRTDGLLPIAMFGKHEYGENGHFFKFIDPAKNDLENDLILMTSYYDYVVNGTCIRYGVSMQDYENGDLDDLLIRDYRGELIRASDAMTLHVQNDYVMIDYSEFDSMAGNTVHILGRNYYVSQVDIEDTVYINEGVANHYGYFFCGDCDEWYHESDDNSHCHDENEDDDYQDSNPRFSYHSCEHFDYSNDSEYKVGIEIEKECSDGCEHSHYSIRERFGWVKERDGSLCDEIGYELVSPAYDLFSDKIMNDAEKIEEAFPMLIDGRTSSNCGGHIHFSKRDTMGADLLESVCGYLPLLYSIYEHRINKTYCKVEEKEAMKNSDNKYQAVKVMRSRIEFRIFPAVKNLQVMQWRLDLIRLMAKNPSSNPMQVAIDLADSKTKLHKHFAKIFKRETIYVKANKALEYAKQFDSNYYNVDMRANMRNTNSKISRLNKADAKKAEAERLVLVVG